MPIISTLNYHVVTLNFHKLCGLIVLSLLSIFVSAAYGQGFDCTKATTEIEKMIRANQPGGRFGRPEEIAEAVVWLCSDRASFVSGESMLVDGGAVAR